MTAPGILASPRAGVVEKTMIRGHKALAAVLGAVILTASCSRAPEPRTRMEFLLGTACSVTLHDRASPDLLDRVFRRVKEIEDRMSATVEDGDIGRVNAGAGKRAVRVEEDTFAVVEAGLEFSRMSGGAFNVAVGPLVSLWGIGTEGARLPEKGEIVAAAARTDYRKVRLHREARTIFLEEPGMALDLGAIAKGYAADEAARLLREDGVTSAVIDFGGNIVALGSHPAGRLWRVGVQNPDLSRGQYLGVLEARDLAVVSSGVYERFFTGPDGKRYHHILDSKTGYPVENGLTGVTVTARDSMVADALSTTFFALGLPAGLELADRIDGVEALFITGGRELHATRGLRESFKVTDPSFRMAGE